MRSRNSMSLPMLRFEGDTVRLIHFDGFDPNGEIAVKYGCPALILDASIPEHGVATRIVRLKTCVIDDWAALALIRQKCKDKNNAFLHLKPNWYIKDPDVQLPDDCI